MIAIARYQSCPTLAHWINQEQQLTLFLLQLVTSLGNSSIDLWNIGDSHRKLHVKFYIVMLMEFCGGEIFNWFKNIYILLNIWKKKLKNWINVLVYLSFRCRILCSLNFIITFLKLLQILRISCQSIGKLFLRVRWNEL